MDMDVDMDMDMDMEKQPAAPAAGLARRAGRSGGAP
mgnify:CR=1 FL=1|jgi:hypothetical protein